MFIIGATFFAMRGPDHHVTVLVFSDLEFQGKPFTVDDSNYNKWYYFCYIEMLSFYAHFEGRKHHIYLIIRCGGGGSCHANGI